MTGKRNEKKLASLEKKTLNTCIATSTSNKIVVLPTKFQKLHFYTTNKRLLVKGITKNKVNLLHFVLICTLKAPNTRKETVPAAGFHWCLGTISSKKHRKLRNCGDRMEMETPYLVSLIS